MIKIDLKVVRKNWYIILTLGIVYIGNIIYGMSKTPTLMNIFLSIFLILILIPSLIFIFSNPQPVPLIKTFLYLMMFFLNWYYRWFYNDDITNLVCVLSLLMFHLGIYIASKNK